MKRKAVFVTGMVLLLFGLVFLNIVTGSVRITVPELFCILAKRGEKDMMYHIVWDIRLPRVLAGVLLGGALAVSGFLLQTFFGNPIAGPYVLGISSGAKLSVALFMIFLLDKGIMISSMGMVLAAFLGAMLAMGFVLLISVRVQKMSLLIVCGILIGYICSAITDFCITFANDSNIVNLHNWSQGSLSGIGFSHIRVMAVMVLGSVILAFFLAKPICAYQLGEAYAKNMGVSIKCLRVCLIVLSSLLAACVTAFAGPISFVGIAVPHLVKTISKTTKPLFMIPGCFIAGGIVTIFCDGIARLVFAPTELSISTVTAIFLVPVVIAMMLRARR